MNTMTEPSKHPYYHVFTGDNFVILGVYVDNGD